MWAILRLISGFLIGKAAAKHTPKGSTDEIGEHGKASESDRAGKTLNKFWLAESAVRLVGSVTPESNQTVGVLAVGFPWASLDVVYQFAIAVAAGLFDPIEGTGFTTTNYINVEIDHTDKTVKVELGFKTSGWPDLVTAAPGWRLINSKVKDPIQGGPWPRFIQDPPLHPALVTIRSPVTNANVVVTGNSFNPLVGFNGTALNVAQDKPAVNSGLGFANGTVGDKDLLLQSPPYNDPCSVVLAPLTNQQMYRLLGIM